ncbi:MAG: sensor histidine kinase [Crocinitomicaceae bacterium]|nr:sensor histidine kinase [Flavobacteriales bacterium]NQZ34124.1 sensor histidine kinase [Crocinitomicaceae bacterium]
MDGNKEIAVTLLLGTAAMLVLALFIITFVVAYQRRLYAKQHEMNEMEMVAQRDLMEAVILAKEKEQKRMAQELHDGIGSALTALKMSLIHMNLEPKEKKQIDNNIKAISVDVRRISNELMPSVLEDMGLQAALERLAQRVRDATLIDCKYSRNNALESLHNDQAQLALYRVVQELLNNIVKYAKATEITIGEELTDGNYILSITDNGRGFEPSDDDLSKSGSLGLKNIKSRIQQVGGSIDYKKLSPKGTVVNIEIQDYEEH